jgi:aryl-alcohol dehydrogenase-like predicted oxidoreductase
MSDQGTDFGRIGFGSYRVDDETPGHRRALRRALDNACTLIDTSTNYTDGGSERMIGDVLAERAGARPTIVSKIGYVQGQNLRLALERGRSGKPFPEMVRYMDGCWHCIHPEFLRDQLTRSRERLRLERLDVCLLHNPEYFLSDPAHRGGGDLEALRGEFYRRIREAFAFFEERARAGEIGAYGVSSNTCTAPADGEESTSVSRFLQAARQAGGDGHRFRVLQLPMNLFESGAALVANTGPDGSRTALEEAAASGLAVLVNRPLNAIVGRRLVRLSDESPAAPAVRRHLDRLLPEPLRRESLSRLAIASVLSIPGVTSVLVGMRQESYVDDALPVQSWPPVPTALEILRTFSSSPRPD